MNWKREAADRLRDYNAKKASLSAIPLELCRLESEFTRIRSATADGTAVRSGGNHREDILLANIIQRGELKIQLEEIKVWVRVVEDALAELDEMEQTVLDRFYINRRKGGADHLCEELHLEKSRVYEIKDRALRKFTLAMYGAMER